MNKFIDLWLQGLFKCFLLAKHLVTENSLTTIDSLSTWFFDECGIGRHLWLHF